MTSAEYRHIHTHKLPPKLIELLKLTERSSIVGFGTTQVQQDLMLLTAILSSKNSVFFEELSQELHDYIVTLSHSLLQQPNR
tara:strand:+ start:6934 stop:7179 length:246 start_codon:yes stop_codon:yes gene_type:complete